MRPRRTGRWLVLQAQCKSPDVYLRDDGKPTSTARFDPVTEVATLPSFAETSAQHHQFLDLAGDGQLDCVVLERPVAGFFERT